MPFRRLTHDELRDLTGLANGRRASIVRWLGERGWVFEIDANGWPIVSETYAEARLAPGMGAAGRQAAGSPNFDALITGG